MDQLNDRAMRIVLDEFSSTPLTSDALMVAVIGKHREYTRVSQMIVRKAIVSLVERVNAERRQLSNPLPLKASAPLDGNDHRDGNTAVPASASLNDVLYRDTVTDAAVPGASAVPPNAAPRETADSVAPAAAAASAAVAAPSVRPKRRRDGDGPGGGGAAARTAAGGSGGGTEWELPPYVRPSVRYADLGGMTSVLSVLRDVVQVPLSLPAAYAHLGVEPPRGVLLHGPPGCGKTLIAHALGGELGVYFRAVAGPELVGALSGESEARLRAVFDDASAHAPSILFIDEIDAIAPRRDDAQRGMERRIVSQLLACIDGLSLKRAGGAHVMLVAASSRPDALDPALRRTGRFDREVAIPIPDEAARADILAVLTRGMRLAGGEAKSDFLAIARATPGFVGADMAALAKEAAAGAIDRALRDGTLSLSQADAPLPSGAIDTLCVTAEDFNGAAKRVQPSALREGFATVPNVSWDDVGALAAVRAELHMAILAPLRQPEAFAALGLAVPAGVLLFGPPGCGKTLLAKALASESRANFIAVKGPELLDKFVGESERAVRALFARARASAPCIIFFDELDALAPRRGGGGGGGGGGESNGVTERVVNQLLTEMDGLETRRDVFVIAATNRPDIIDPAMLRPGRLDKLLYVPLPTGAERAAILRTQARRTPLAADVDFDAIAQHAAAARFSGADLASLVREAAVGVLRVYLGIDGSAAPEAKGAPPPLAHADFIAAFQKVQPSVSPADERMYNDLRRKLRGGGDRAGGGGD